MDDLSVCASVCPVHFGKTADRIRKPFDIMGRTAPGMRQVVGFGDRPTGRGTFVGKFGARHCNQWGLCGVGVRQCLNRRSCGLQRRGFLPKLLWVDLLSLLLCFCYKFITHRHKDRHTKTKHTNRLHNLPPTTGTAPVAMPTTNR